MTSLNQNRFFIPTGFGFQAGTSGQRNLGGKAAQSGQEFAAVLEETMAVAPVAAPSAPASFPAQLANTAYWAHPSYGQAVLKKAV